MEKAGRVVSGVNALANSIARIVWRGGARSGGWRAGIAAVAAAPVAPMTTMLLGSWAMYCCRSAHDCCFSAVVA